MYAKEANSAQKDPLKNTANLQPSSSNIEMILRLP